MTSSNGNIFHVTSPLLWESTGRGAVMFSLTCAWTSAWASHRDAGGLRPHRAHYVLIMMYLKCSYLNELLYTSHFPYENNHILCSFGPLQLFTTHWISRQKHRDAVFLLLTYPSSNEIIWEIICLLCLLLYARWDVLAGMELMGDNQLARNLINWLYRP